MREAIGFGDEEIQGTLRHILQEINKKMRDDVQVLGRINEVRLTSMMGILYNHMSFNFTTWNVMEVISEESMRALRRVMRKLKPLIVTIQEKKKVKREDC